MEQGRRDDALASTVATLPPVYRAALSYAQPAVRRFFAAIFVLDQSLARTIARASEPLAAQIRLAWWREELATPALSATPLSAFIAANWPAPRGSLVQVVDAWEELLAETPDYEAVAAGRARPFEALAGQRKCDAAQSELIRLAAMRWALVDLAGHLSLPTESARAFDAARILPATGASLPRAFRPLAVLDGLSRRALKGGGRLLLGDRLSPLAAMRLGIFGR